MKNATIILAVLSALLAGCTGVLGWYSYNATFLLVQKDNQIGAMSQAIGYKSEQIARLETDRRILGGIINGYEKMFDRMREIDAETYWNVVPEQFKLEQANATREK